MSTDSNKDNKEKKKKEDINNGGELEIIQKKADEYLAGWKRAKADYSNLKREQERKNKEVVEYAHAHVISEFISVYNNFKMAAQHKPATENNDWQNWAVGIDHIQKQFLDVLKKFNLAEIETVGKKFDPAMHESMGDDEAEDVESGKIIKEVQPGYTLNGKVVVPAKVIIAK